jgi:hypothetical protein
VTLTDALGGRRDVLLGKFGTKQSRREHVRVIAEWEAAGHSLPKPIADADLSVWYSRYALGIYFRINWEPFEERVSSVKILDRQ